MHQKTYPIQVWFLSEDIQQSAQWLADKHLSKTLMGCLQALASARFYFSGVRTMNVFKHLFSKERRKESMENLFPLWPLKITPSFSQYKSRISKWCRMCFEHYSYVKSYMNALLDEYEYRAKKPHGLAKFIEWEEIVAPKLNIPKGNIQKITVPWKCLNPKYRRKDICLGYRLQYKAMIEANGGLKMFTYRNRDIPEFLIPEANVWME